MNRRIQNLFADPIIMPNNLDAVIRASEMNKKQVAQAAGVNPETLSRHIHGKVQMTLENAERYAEILDVSVKEIMFVNPPTPIMGEAFLKDDDKVERTMYEKWDKGVLIPDNFSTAACAILYKADPSYRGYWYEYVGALGFYLKEPVKNKNIHPACIQNVTLVKLQETIKLPGSEPTRYLAGVLYPEPGDLYTIDSPKNGINLRGLKLEWATPFISALFRPDLRGITSVEIESEI